MLSIDLTGHKAFVTAGARGIGSGIVRALAGAGADVAFTYQGSERGVAASSSLISDLEASSRRIVAYQARGEDPAGMEASVAGAAAALGGIDIVVPNVGRTWVAPVPELDLVGWQRAIDINLTSAFLAIKLCHPWLVKAGSASVVIIGSSTVVDGGGGGIHYAAAKAGLDGMVKGLMREYPRQGIRVNVIHPCVVDTDLLRDRYDTEEKRRA